MGEALGGGGKGAHRWRSGVRWSRNRHSSAGEAWDVVARGRAGGMGSIGRDGGGGGEWHGIERAGGRRGVEQDAQGRTSGAGSGGRGRT
jgi:hypothetical protein